METTQNTLIRTPKLHRDVNSCWESGYATCFVWELWLETRFKLIFCFYGIICNQNYTLNTIEFQWKKYRNIIEERMPKIREEGYIKNNKTIVSSFRETTDP